MISSSEAFEKFSIWNTRRTSLKVTVIERGKPEDVYLAWIDALDEDASQVGIKVTGASGFGVFDVGQAEFSWELGRLVASRDDAEWLIFEEDSSEK
jgi:hypothetical protein